MNPHAMAKLVNVRGAGRLGAGALVALLVTLTPAIAGAAHGAPLFPDESADPNEVAPGAPSPASSQRETGSPPEEARKAEEEEASARFGDKGGLVLTGATNLSGSSTSYSHSDAASTALSFNPSFDYFFDDNVSLGVVLPFSYSNATGYGADGSSTKFSSTSLGLGARLGYNAVLSARFSLYMLATLGGSTQSYDEELVRAAPGSTTTPASNAYSSAGFWVQIEAPLLFHVTPHFFAGLGPYLYRDLSRSIPNDPRPDNLRTTVGAGLYVGGWL